MRQELFRALDKEVREAQENQTSDDGHLFRKVSRHHGGVEIVTQDCHHHRTQDEPQNRIQEFFPNHGSPGKVVTRGRGTELRTVRTRGGADEAAATLS
jgi:hypothetical protein